MSLLFESIKYEEGKLCNLSWHEKRMKASIYKLFGKNKSFNLKKILATQLPTSTKLYKCRLEYDQNGISAIKWEAYKRKNINAILFIKNDEIKYYVKLTDRSCFEKYTKDLPADAEVIFIKNNYLTDSSFSNIALYNGKEWHTPTYPLLKGTARERLLQEGKIISKKIKYEQLHRYKKISFITALNDLNQIVFEF